MKKMIVLLAMALIATTSFGWVSISWSAEEGLLSAYEGATIGFVLNDTQTKRLTWDLVYTEASAAAPVLNEKTGAISYGDDIVLSRRTYIGDGQMSVVDNPNKLEDLKSDSVSTTPVDIAPEGYIDGDSLYNNGLFDASNGKVYAAVFQELKNGEVWYAVTALTAVKGYNPEVDPMKPFPSDVSFLIDYEDEEAGIFGTKLGSKLGTITQVPEPATMSLLGLGALAMVIRRKLRK